jgi:hypothetical protein
MPRLLAAANLGCSKEIRLEKSKMLKTMPVINLSTDLNRIRKISDPKIADACFLHSEIKAGYGHCSVCSCPGFLGSGYTCTRGGCAHHFDQHR